MLGLPAAIPVKGRDGKLHQDVAMWTFWSLQEGTLGVDPMLQRTNDGKMPPVIHLDTDAPLHSDVDGSLITDKLWGIYYKPDFNFGGIQGGAMPFKVKADPAAVKIDPYGPESPDFVVGDDFAHMWCSALAFCQKRFEGKIPVYKKEPSGGIGSFTADSFPMFDRFCENVYVIADSNHGYKMIGVGKLVADDLCGRPIGPGKMRGGDEAAGNADLHHGERGVPQQLTRLLQPHTDVVVGRRAAEITMKQPLQLTG
jgi:hypothetical protein